ncbi:GNAT family N-acetyltransferase [Halobacteriales archaeon QS_4_69_225]|nr:MAG: GNAT family N-acetyltransferase [Halobacteriales archaeon QS_4_69_225]
MDVRRVDGEAGMADALGIRRAVFIEEQDVPEELELDGNDEVAMQFVAYDDGRPVGTARLREGDETTAKAERVAVLSDERGRGIGRRLMAAVEAHAVEAGYEVVVLNAQVPVVGFYEQLGYATTSDVFEDAGIPHRKMRKGLSERDERF